MEENESNKNLLILKTLESRDYHRIYYYINQGKLKKIETKDGIAVDVDELIALGNGEVNLRQSKKEYPRIDLRTPSRLNAVYRRLSDLDRMDDISARRIKGLPKYKDENGYLCINMIDYLAPQIKLIARKIGCKQYKVKAVLYDLFYQIYTEEKDERKKYE